MVGKSEGMSVDCRLRLGLRLGNDTKRKLAVRHCRATTRFVPISTPGPHDTQYHSNDEKARPVAETWTC